MNDKRTTVMCGGCGNYDPAQRCIGCLHEFTPAAKPVPEQISDELLAKMLAAAENAGGREWFTDPRPTAEGLAVVDDGASMWPVKCEWPQAQFVALANPAALIALLTELQHRREAEAGTQCCMCGKTGLSTIEGDGGQECELDDGRWVCSGECWDRAVAASPSSPASGVRVTEAMLDKALIAQHENDPAWKKRYDATAIRLRTEDMTRALIAALGEHP